MQWRMSKHLLCRLVEVGVTVVAPAGDSSTSACGSTPVAAPFAITVGASDEADSRMVLPGDQGSNFGSCVDIYAPGHLVPGASSDGDRQGSVRSGTSQAAALVAGAAVLVLKARPHAAPAEVRQALLSAAAVGAVGTSASEGPGRAPRIAPALPVCEPVAPRPNTRPASLQLESTVLRPQLALDVTVMLGQESATQVTVFLSDSAAARFFNGTSVVLAPGQTEQAATLQPDAALLFQTPSSQPFRLYATAQSKESAVNGRTVPILVCFDLATHLHRDVDLLHSTHCSVVVCSTDCMSACAIGALLDYPKVLPAWSSGAEILPPMHGHAPMC
jgi:Subtilase family